MSKSLQDQLKALGLAKEPAARPLAKRVQKPHKGSSQQAPVPQENRRSKTGHSTSGQARPGQGKSKQNGQETSSGTPLRPADDASNLTLEQAYVLREQLRKAEEEASKENKRLEDLKRRQINNAIKAIVEPYRLNNPDAELARHFMYKGRIRKVNVTLEQFKALNEGELGLVYLSGGYHVLPTPHVDEVRALSEEHVPDLSGGAEEEEQFPVPDDLIW